MTPDERDDMTRALKRWKWREDRQAEARGPLVLGALDLGFTKEEVHQLTGLGRTTVDRIAKSRQQEEQGR